MSSRAPTQGTTVSAQPWFTRPSTRKGDASDISRIRKPKQEVSDEPDPDLMLHVRSLGLKTVAEYVGWCAAWI